HPVKRTVTLIGSMVLIAALTGAPVAVAQERPTLVPLKVQLVVSRHAADKKVISSLPYTLWMTANRRNTTSVRMGVQVPIATGALSVSKEGVPAPSYQYRDIGTNID